MLQKDFVNTYLSSNYERIQEARKFNNFSWGPIISEILAAYPEMQNDPVLTLDPESRVHRERVRNNFLNIRKRRESIAEQRGFPQATVATDSSQPVTPLPIRKLFFDIETSPNIVFSWTIGANLFLTPDNIIQERAIICICYKWEGEDTVHDIRWTEGDDKPMLEEFAKVAATADILVGHNSDQYDIKWVRSRCMLHGIKFPIKPDTIDTLKMARRQFKLNSNKLDYIGQFLGVGQKMDTGGFKLWKEICLNHNPEAMDKMVSYCKQDVILLEKIYHILAGYSPIKKFKPKEHDFPTTLKDDGAKAFLTQPSLIDWDFEAKRMKGE